MSGSPMPPTPDAHNVPAAGNPCDRKETDFPTTYTLLAKTADGEVVARDVPLTRALVIAVENRRTGRATVTYRKCGQFLIFEIGCRSPDGQSFEPILNARVPTTRHSETNANDAIERFEAILLHDPGEFFDGRIERNVEPRDPAEQHFAGGDVSREGTVFESEEA
ncbi:MAG: hypothetical protein QHD01_02915 [Bradyrhizobium sp.]|uniref:hypothetical protein n=1 Tax=Bradyrhizobium sp. TaxID=376 RepID=UPI0029AF0516|nr:hypothetical protein [Bradyrhizobium sp.]MDX3965536.1 hypothetical protein [Bradyrhizobium sp.]